MKILVLNAGSSSLKCWYHDLSESALQGPAPQPLWQQQIDSTTPSDIDAILRAVPGSVDVVGHRVVHGGKIHESTLVTPRVRAAIAEESSIAPAHNQAALAGMDAIERVFGSEMKQVAVFDTAFHASMPAAAYVYAGPYAWVAEGIRRYGFHGISHGYAARTAAKMLGKDASALRLVTCHIGSGASLAAVRAGKSIDTTMGFSPLEGLMMGSRSGSIDPAILIYLMRQHGYTADQLDDLLNHQSGLLGVSGISADMRKILEAIGQGIERARLAFDIYTHRLVREIGSMIAVLGGADALVFTGGVGENCAPLRDAVEQQFRFLQGLQILVVHAEEEWEIARECYALTSAER